MNLKKKKNRQMDVVCRYCEKFNNKLTVIEILELSIYGTSTFEGILVCLKPALNPIAIEKIMQLSMDIPNVQLT